MNRFTQKQLWLLIIVVLSFSACKTHSYVADIDTSYERIDSYKGEDDNMTTLVEPYKEQLDKIMYEVLAHTEVDLKKGKPDSPLGNWFCEILAVEAERIYGVDIAFATQNYGGLRIPVMTAGDITRGDIFELMPFDNEMLVLELDGKTMQELLDLIASHNGWPLSAGISFTIADDKATDVIIKGIPLNMSKKYYIAIADYVANGGDNAFFLKDLKRMDKDLLIRDVVIDYLKNLPEAEKNIKVNNTQRISN